MYGFSLLEVLTSSLIASAVMALALSALSLQRASVSRVETQSRLREPATFALQVIAQRTQMAGYGLGFGVVGVGHLEGVSALAACDGCGEYDTSTDGSSLAIGTDQLIVLYRNPETEFTLATSLYQADPAPCGTSLLLSSPAGPRRALPAGCVVSCRDERTPSTMSRAFAWTLQAAVTTGSATSSTVGEALRVQPNTSDDFLSACPSTLPIFLRCGSMMASTLGFYIQNGVLWMDDDGDSLHLENGEVYLAQASETDDIPLARSVEDFQVAFCFSPTDATSEACLLQPSSSSWRAPSRLSDTELAMLRAVRLTIVTRERAESASQHTERPSVENHTPGGTTDEMLRLVSSIVVPVPNLGYMLPPEEQP